MKRAWIAAAAASVVLTGCKTEFAAEVPLSKLQDPAVKELPAAVRLEVLTCDNYEDSRKPSDALIKAQQMMPRVFPSAEFSECYNQGMDSWAEFDIALPIDRDNDPKAFASDDAFNLTTTKDLPLGVAVPPAVVQRLEEAKRADMMMSDLEYAITLKVINDTGEPFPTTVMSAWVDDQPLTFNGMEVPAGESFSLRFSDVLIDRAIKTGEASVLIDFERLLDKRNG